MKSIKESLRWFLVRKLLELHRWLRRIDESVDVERIEHMTEALLTRAGLPFNRDGTGKCWTCHREVRMLITDTANLADRRCLRCAPANWVELYCSNVERALEQSAPREN